MGRSWSGSGPIFRIDWGGRDAALRVDGAAPGIGTTPEAPVLWLAGLAARGRQDLQAFSGSALSRFEHHLNRIEATYLPPGWRELTVRADWGPYGDDGIDLVIEVTARSVGELRELEVLVGCDLGRGRHGGVRQVAPRDRRAAGRTYDGREARLDDLITRAVPPPGRVEPCWETGEPCQDPASERRLLLMARPEDVSRRIIDAKGPTTLALLGHDLERGVVLRGRVRALWLPPGSDADADALSRARYAAFTQEPPPLSSG